MKIKGKHVCKLKLGSDTQLQQKELFWERLRHRFWRVCQISQYHPYTFCHFYSYPAVMIERQRQSYEGKNVIHPFSMFSLFWKSLMVFINVAHMSTSTFRVSFILDEYYRHNLHPFDTVMLVLDSFCLVDIIINFHMGYTRRKPEGIQITLNRKHILANYLRKWFVLDVLSSMPLSYMLLQWYTGSHSLLICLLLPMFRLPRTYSVVADLTTFVKIFSKKYVWYGGTRHAVLFWLTAHWCSCLIYLPLVYSRYWHQDWKQGGQTGQIIIKRSMGLSDNFKMVTNPELPLGRRYLKSLFVSLSGFFGTGFSLLQSTKLEEILVYSLVIIYSAMFMVYNFVFLLKVYLSMYNPTIRYHELINQVEAYMRLKQLPLQLKERLRAFYYYRYQENYYSENTVLSILSEELRNEIMLHTCHKLVTKLALFKDVPAEIVGSVLGCLHSEVYMPKDSVLRAGDIGDCMYFIAHGTVAIYSLKGVEVCHLEDGAYFGEVALLMKDSKRVATAVAVEISQLYRLDVKDFKEFIMSHELLYNRIAALASERMHETVVLDDEFRREREKMRDSATTLLSHSHSMGVDPQPPIEDDPEFQQKSWI